MTTIKSATGDPELTIMPAFTPGVMWLEIDRNGRSLGINVPTAELAAALGLVTREELDRKQAAWENECGNLEMTQRERDALRAELDEAEKALAAVNAELDEAEATIARVWELTADADPNDRFTKREIRAVLDPKPAFVLPTEAGAELYADREGEEHLFETIESAAGWLYLELGTGYAYTADELMNELTNHRLIGADDDV